MIDIPKGVRNFNFRSSSIFDHPTCSESEPNYNKLLTYGKFADNSLIGFNGDVIGKIISPVPVLDILRLEPDFPFLPKGIIKNPLYLPKDNPNQIGANSGLVATVNWLYIGRIRDGKVEIIRPVRDNYYTLLRNYFDLLTNKY